MHNLERCELCKENPKIGYIQGRESLIKKNKKRHVEEENWNLDEDNM